MSPSRALHVLVASSLALTCACAPGRPPQPARSEPGDSITTIQLLAINDLHGNLEPPTGQNGLVNQTQAGGAAYLAAHLARAVARNPNSLLVGAGDLVGASPLLSGLLHDEPTIEALNAMHLAVSAMGNHELDEGQAELQRMQGGGCHPVDGCRGSQPFAGARFQYLAANVVRDDTRQTLLPPTAIVTVGGVKLGLIGETLQRTPSVVAVTSTRGLTFLDEASTANRYAAQLKAQGAQAVVLLIHEGGRQRPAGALDPNGCEAFSGGIEPIAQALSADIPVVVTGHVHELFNCRIGAHLVTGAGSTGRAFTRIELQFDRRGGRFLRATATNEVVTRDVAPDAAVAALVDRYRALAAPLADQAVGSSPTDITRTPSHAGESALGDLVADAHLEAARRTMGNEVSVSFINSGGIRADLIAQPARGVLRAGDVTYADLFKVSPFGNTLMAITITGADIRRLLEQQFDNPRPGGARMLQVSKGFTYRYRLNAPAGERVDPASIRIDGRLVQPSDRVRASTLDFLVFGGDGFTAFHDATDIVSVTPDIDALAEYVRGHSPLIAPALDRVVRED